MWGPSPLKGSRGGEPELAQDQLPNLAARRLKTFNRQEGTSPLVARSTLRTRLLHAPEISSRGGELRRCGVTGEAARGRAGAIRGTVAAVASRHFGDAVAREVGEAAAEREQRDVGSTVRCLPPRGRTGGPRRRACRRGGRGGPRARGDRVGLGEMSGTGVAETEVRRPRSGRSRGSGWGCGRVGASR
ncbi:hypothetical protein SBD_2884 [Streptomyces bottropensis ATCC 25435]|uniref:Uncharacterized protein n=1 Tax=Streptomyces bottropensis ATCC 25435 TaxID=1054862 RepID=M3EH06_9ACTN|nr:hypothetical protein SBD_2884 [Streptomyces bottropensis ATCC 25435]